MGIGRNRGRLAKKATRGVGRSAGKAALLGGKPRTGPTRWALAPAAPAGARYLRYGLIVLVGFAVGGLLGRRGEREEVSPPSTQSTQPTPASEVPASDPGVGEERRDQPLGSADGTEGPGGDGGEGSVRDEPEARGLEAEEEAPTSEPTPAEDQPESADVAAQQGGIEGIIRARVEEDPRTRGLQLLDVEVDDGMVMIEGTAPSTEAKAALTDVVGDVEGVNIVVNRVMVSFQ